MKFDSVNKHDHNCTMCNNKKRDAFIAHFYHNIIPRLPCRKYKYLPRQWGTATEAPRMRFAQRIFEKCFCKSLKQTLNSISRHDNGSLLLPFSTLQTLLSSLEMSSISSLYAQHSRFREWLQRFCLASPTVSVFLLDSKRAIAVSAQDVRLFFISSAVITSRGNLFSCRLFFV